MNVLTFATEDERGEELPSMRIIIDKIYTHPTDTRENILRAPRHYGASFIDGLKRS